MVLIAVAALDAGPLGFLHPLVRVPLVVAALTAGRWPRATELVCVAAIVTNWVLLRTIGLHPSRSDDSIYFYLATRMAEGAVPYRDFFFAHPPLHLVVPAALFKVTGFSLVLARALPAALQTLAAVLLYVTVRPYSRALGVVTLALHLNAYRVLMGATDLTGANLICVALAAALWASSRERAGLAGLFAALSLGVGLYSAAGVLALALAQSQHRCFWLGFAGGLAAWALPAWLVGGQGFIDGVVGYHLARHAGGGSLPMKEALSLFAFHPLHVVAALVSLGLLIRRWHDRTAHVAKVGLVAALLFFLEWVALRRVHGYYMVPQVMCLSLAAAWAVWRVIRRPAVVTVAVLSLAPFAVAWWPSEAGERVTLTWHAPPYFAGLTRALYFSPERELGTLQPGWRHYVWNKSRTVSTAAEMAAFLRENTRADETLSGASTLAPLLALLSGRRLAADEADTNSQRFSTGSLDERTFFQRICAANVRYLVAAPQSYFTEATVDRHRAFVREREFIETEIRFGRAERYVLYRLRDEARCADQ